MKLIGTLILFALIFAFCQECDGFSGIRFQPNTLLEFMSRSCKGDFNKQAYSFLNRICDDCYNLVRNPSVSVGCRTKCFNNSLFGECVKLLLLDPKEEDITSKVQLVNGMN